MKYILRMKMHLPKIRLSLFWIPYGILLWYFDLHRMMFLVFIMLCIHELGHLLMGIYLGLRIDSITIFPFGLFAKYEDLDQYPSKYESLMAISGPLFQICNFIFLNILYQYNFLSLNQLDYYQMINIQMFVFNILPIFPLDGGRIMRAVCMHFFPYKVSLHITYIISMVVAVIAFFTFSFAWKYIFIIVFIIFWYQQYQLLLEHRLQFYYKRFVSDVVLPNKKHRYFDLYKDYHNIIFDGVFMNEKEWLSRFFVKNHKR